MTGDIERAGLERAGLERAGLRASDADRQAVAQRLQRAVDEGRLDLDDYDERLRDAYSAKTYAELDRVTADLPEAVAAAPVATDKAPANKPRQLEEWRYWGGAAVVLIAIWGITSIAAGSLIFFWPMFPLGIWAAILVAGMVSGGSKRSC